MANDELVKTTLTELRGIAGSLKVRELTDIKASAAENLKRMISDPDGVFASDPELCLKAYTELSKAENAAVESQRRVADTLLKAKSILDPAPVAPSNDVAPAIEGSGAPSIFG